MLFLPALHIKNKQRQQQEHRAEVSLDKKGHLSQLTTRTPQK